MPPQISDDEASEASEEDFILQKEKVTTVERKGRGNALVEETRESLDVESDKEDGDEDDDDEEPGEDEYIVEAIMDHLVDEDTETILYQVKWEGYDKKADMTWEPEVNLETAPEILEEYLTKVGGKDLILAQWAEKKAGKRKKRGRASTGNGATSGANGTVAKRGRKNASHPASATPPAGVRETGFKPPTGSWEDEVVAIDACEGSAGTVVVYLTWKGGQKTQHPLNQVYKRCPQKMLKFYESHLVFKKNEDTPA